MFARIAAFVCILLVAACTAPSAVPAPAAQPVPAHPAVTDPVVTAEAAQPASSSAGTALPEAAASAPAPAPGNATAGVATQIPPSMTPTAPALSQPSSAPPGPITATGAISATAVPALAAPLPAFKHVFIIVMENKESSEIFGSAAAPYINELASDYAYAANYFGIRHPSLPNYLALAGGDNFGVTSDCTTCFITADNIVDQMEQAGRSWKAYMESMPAPCFQGPGNTLYAQKHNPFIYFNDVRTDPTRCHKIVPFEQLQADLAANALPAYVWITPNLCHDMHDCPVSSGDDWLKTWVPKILASSAWQDNGVLFITFDEGVSAAGCCQYAAGGKITTLVISPLAKKGFVSHVPYNHYSLLRTVEQAWGLPPLHRAACDCSPPMTDFFVTR